VSEPAKLPFLFVFILLGTAAVCAALDVLSAWGSAGPVQGGFTLTWALHRIPRSLYDVIVPSVVLSIVLLGIRVARRRLSRFVAFCIVLAVGYLALVNGMVWVRPLAAEPAPQSARQYLAPSHFVQLGSRLIAARTVSDHRLGSLLVFDPAGAPPRMTVIPS
jgi:hypothetical protein